MANLTVTIDDDLLQRARVKAVAAGTSVNALLRSYLESFAGHDASQVRNNILDHALAHRGSSGPQGRSWTRDDLHER